MSAKVLLIEDNQTDIDLTRRVFSRMEDAPELVVIDDGKEALSYLLATSEQAEENGMPALIILDLKMPGMSGIEILQQLRKHTKTRRIPVVILSCSTEQNDLRSAYDNGANSYIRKPVDFALFTETMHTLVKYWFKVNRFAESGDKN